MICNNEKQIEEVRRQIDALAVSGDVSEENIRRRNILSVKLSNLLKKNNRKLIKAHSYGYDLKVNMRQIEGLGAWQVVY